MCSLEKQNKNYNNQVKTIIIYIYSNIYLEGLLLVEEDGTTGAYLLSTACIPPAEMFVSTPSLT